MQNYNFVKNDVFVAKICKYALYESSEGLFCAPRKAANFCHPVQNVQRTSKLLSCAAWDRNMSVRYLAHNLKIYLYKHTDCLS